jgi:hypothetical protein
MKGMNYRDIEEMPSEERIWYINRLGSQLEKEMKKIKGK